MKEKKDKQQIKQILIYILVLYAIFTAVPAFIYGISKLQSKNPTSTVSQIMQESSSYPSNFADNDSTAAAPEATPTPLPGFLDGLTPQGLFGNQTAAEDFRILDQATGQVLTVSPKEFLIAATACEMSPEAPAEALKAQAVAAYTFYTRERQISQLGNADFTCNTAQWLVYVSKSQMQSHWGEGFADYYAKLEAVVDAVAGQLLTEQEKPLCSTYFAISSGKTEASVNVWGEDLPYLQSVASPGDVFSDGYRSTVTLSENTLQEKLQAAFADKNMDFSLPKAQWFQRQETSTAGYTTSVLCCGISVSGRELRTALSLSSTCFTVSYTQPNFTFTVSGSGHGVGMSQAGAMFMAQQGSSYQDILSHYYPGSVLKK